jgi:OmcA/MtrC family decaheme c-type cytochrome
VNLQAVPGVMNCRTCHDNQRVTQPATRPAADQAAWMTNISQRACRTCHDGTVATNVDFSSHFGNQVDNSVCGLCHGPTAPLPVNVAHATPYSTPNNPELSAGARRVAYEISSLTVNASNQPTVTFRILVDGTPLDLRTITTTSTPIAIGGVNFKLAWSAPMPTPVNVAHGPAIAQPLDWNNFGTTTGRQYWNDSTSLGATALAFDQPLSVNLSTAGLLASLAGPDANGFFTTLPGIHPTTPLAFPANTTLRGVAMESTLTITVSAGPPAVTLALAGDSVVKGVDGATTLRRQVVDIDKCNTCHERVGFHGSAGRANNPDHCVMCHNAELSSSNIYAGLFNGFEVSQKPNNFKNMLHAIHGAEVRTVPFNFIRGNSAATSGGQGLHVFEEVGFPARLADCAACHRPGTFGALSNDRYAWSVVDAQPALGSVATFNPALSVRVGPNTGACGGCHDDWLATAHMQQNSGGGETCALCHGPGELADVAAKHAR